MFDFGPSVRAQFESASLCRDKMLKIIITITVFLLSASIALGQQPAELAVVDRAYPLRFDHRCSKPDLGPEGVWQAYAFFEKRPSEDRYKALVLANVQVGWVGGLQGPNGVALAIQKMRFVLPPEWYNATFGLALQLVDVKTQQAITGPVSTSYLHDIPGDADQYPREYQLSATGELNWVNFAELGEGDSESAGGYNDSHNLHVYGRDIPALEGAYTLNLVVENTRTSAGLTLEGPVLDNLQSLLQIERPKMRVLGFFQAMNPFQEGGVWDWIKTSRRYGKCIQLRKQAKQDFDRHFARSSSRPPSSR